MTVASDNESVLDERPTVEPSPGEDLRTITRLFTELQTLSFACCDVQSATQCSVLTTLARQGDQTLAGLTRLLNLDKAWLSRTTDQLAEDGLLLKAPHPADRRALLLRLTLEGQQAAHTLNEQLNAQASRVLARLKGADRATTVRLLGALKDALQDELSAATCGTPGGP